MPRNKNNDADPSIVINFGDGNLELNYDNATLYTFLGENAMYNHVLIQTEEDAERGGGTYVFRHVEGFKRLAKQMLRNHFPAIINQTDVALCDMEVFEKSIGQMTSDVKDFVPEGWE